MYSQLSFSNQLPSMPNAFRLQALLVAGNWAMLMGVVMTLCSIVASYQFADSFSLAVQILLHISTLLFATLVKFGYIMRCVSLHEFEQGALS